MIEKKTYVWLFALVALAYIVGMFLPLMENDSAQFGCMALRMHNENDYLNLIKRDFDYLDKPHMHYWLAVFSFKIFGVHNWSYRLPSLLFSILGAWSTFGLGELLYNKHVGRLAALILVTAQAFVLANHDVRTDAVLLGATIFGLWQLIEYIKTNKLLNMILGAAGVAIAFSTKGQIAVFVSGIAILCYLLYERKWKTVWSWKVLVGLAVFLLVSTPMFYAYYQQFDLHPEKVVNGQTGSSGIWFIIWGQSLARLAGQEGSTDYFFFYHTFLWAFLPWSLITVAAMVRRTIDFFKIKFKKQPGYEFLTLGGILIILHIINFSDSKLPHYLNILFPLFAIITASYIYNLAGKSITREQRNQNTMKVILVVQFVIVSVMIVLAAVLSLWVFPVDNILIGITASALLVLIILQTFKRHVTFGRIVVVSVLMSVLLNFVLNANFYPKLLKYQGGAAIAEQAKNNGVQIDSIYIYDKLESMSLDFYSGRINPWLSFEELQQKITEGEKIWLFVYEEDKKVLEEKGISWTNSLSAPHFRVSMLKSKFLNPATRDQAITHAYLLEIN